MAQSMITRRGVPALVMAIMLSMHAVCSFTATTQTLHRQPQHQQRRQPHQPLHQQPHQQPQHQLSRRKTRRAAVPTEVSLLAGMIGGSIGVGVAYPLDTIKVKTQAFMDSAAPGERAPSPWALAQRVLQNEGLGAFYGGVTSTMVGQAMIKGVVFWAYEASKLWLMGVTGADLGPWLLFLAACISGAVGSFVVTPVERVKCVMQAASAGEFESPVACVQEVVRSDGLGGFFSRGLGATMAREIPAYGFYFVAYEGVKTFLLGALGGGVGGGFCVACGSGWQSALVPLVPLVGGAAAGVASWVPVYPIDVVKTNVQVAVDGGRRESAVDVARRLYSTGGVGAFWDGIGPKVARAIVNHAATFVIFEQVCTWYARSNGLLYVT